MFRRLMAIAPLAILMACAERTRSDADTTDAATQAQAAATATGSTAAGSDVPGAGGMTDPNTATREQLAAAGADSGTIAALMTGRPFADMVAVDRALAGRLSAERRKALYAKVWKATDLNTAKGEEILLIPGVGARMRHELEEYRPYTSMEQFRREIGKYVSKEEVARLEQYVTIR